MQCKRTAVSKKYSAVSVFHKTFYKRKRCNRLGQAHSYGCKVIQHSIHLSIRKIYANITTLFFTVALCALCQNHWTEWVQQPFLLLMFQLKTNYRGLIELIVSTDNAFKTTSFFLILRPCADNFKMPQLQQIQLKGTGMSYSFITSSAALYFKPTMFVRHTKKESGGFAVNLVTNVSVCVCVYMLKR